MPTGPAGIRQGLQLTLLLAFGLHGLFDAKELLVGSRNFRGFAKDGDLEEAGFDGFREVGDLFELR